MTLMMLITMAYGLEKWQNRAEVALKPRVLNVAVVVLMAWSSKDLLLRYPLLWTPEVPEIARAINEDPNPGQVLVYPQEEDAIRAVSHFHLRSNTSFSNPQIRIWFQTLIDRPMRHHTRLATMVARENPRNWPLDDGSLSADLQGLQERGLRYVILDHSQLTEESLAHALQVVDRLGHQCRYFPEWGGLELCLLDGH